MKKWRILYIISILPLVDGVMVDYHTKQNIISAETKKFA